MKHQVRISERAEADVDEVLRWFCDQPATEAGARWYARLLAKIDTLEMRPHRCRLADDADELGIELREILFGRRTIAFR